MPKIFDNISLHLKTGLSDSLNSSFRADFCVGYFNLRGWKYLMEQVDKFKGEVDCCRLLVGMQRSEDQELLKALDVNPKTIIDNPTALAFKKEIVKSFIKQLTFGIPTEEDELSLRNLKRQLEEKKLKVKLFLNYPLHAKLYLCFKNNDNDAPLIGYVGSSNLTMAGLSNQGELNVNVVDEDSARKLERWFEDRWNDRWCIDISSDLINVLNESWAGESAIPPYFIYLKIAYHLSQEARSGIGNYVVPRILMADLLPFQINAVSFAARHLDKRGGVLISDVVGLGKTMTATAVAKLFEETYFTETLIVCPKNLVEMWAGYKHRYQLRGDVFSISKIDRNFLDKQRYRIIIIDESHNLRNREGKRYAIIREYIEKNESRVIMLTATPYNKSYLDISSQLRLFIPEDKDIGVSPENFIRDTGGPVEFIAQYQYSPNTLLAFEKSTYSEDWQELLKLYMVRRTRTFIKENYGTYDPQRNQYFLTFNDGRIEYFPDRIPQKIEYSFNPEDKTDVYVKLYDDEVVKIINSLFLARYGLGNFIDKSKEANATSSEAKVIENLSRAGKRLMGFCRTNLFKRLESSGFSFLVSLARHVLRNHVFIYAFENQLPFPIGQQETAEMDEFLEENDNPEDVHLNLLTDKEEYKDLAQKYYSKCVTDKNRYDWISSTLFDRKLPELLSSDADKLLSIIEIGKAWNPAEDKQLNALENLCQVDHKEEKVLIFTQFADTARYLLNQFNNRGIKNVECATGDLENPTDLAQRFSPVSNNLKGVKDEIRILISTDVLSEGQNLQDAHIIVNYDLPWAIIRLIQRAGRVDRIGQHFPEIYCYSFLPQDGLERIIRLRDRLIQRISENAEAVGADEVFFDGDPVNIADLYNLKAGILDDDEGDVDLTSQAYEIWNQAIKANPELKKKIPRLPDVVYSTKQKLDDDFENESVITYHRNSSGYEVLSWLNAEGKIISSSQSRILKMAGCSLDTPAVPRLENHHALVKKAVLLAETEAAKSGGQLGNKASARYKAYGMMQRHYESVKNSLFDTDALKKTIDDIYHYPMRETAREIINRRIRLGCTDEDMALLAIQLREEGRLCIIEQKEEDNIKTPHIICSLGIKKSQV